MNRPERATRRRWGNNDAVDAEATARPVLSGQPLVTPKTRSGPVELVRVLQLGRASTVTAHTQTIN